MPFQSRGAKFVHICEGGGSIFEIGSLIIDDAIKYESVSILIETFVLGVARKAADDDMFGMKAVVCLDSVNN